MASSISNRTVGKALKQARKQGAPKLSRAANPHVHSGASAAEVHPDGSIRNVKPNAWVGRGDVPYESKRKNPKLFPNLQDKRLIAVHETGHTIDPKFPKESVEIFKRDLNQHNITDIDKGLKHWGKTRSMAISSEKKANKIGHKLVKQLGTPQEGEAFKKFANEQIKYGYRNPYFEHARNDRKIKEALLGKGKGYLREPNTMARDRQILKEYPWLRKKWSALSEFERNIIRLEYKLDDIIRMS